MTPEERITQLEARVKELEKYVFPGMLSESGSAAIPQQMAYDQRGRGIVVSCGGNN